jgi:uncharacterized membrane protein
MYDLRASYWLVPAIMALLAIALGAVTVWLDAGPAAGIMDGLGWYQKAKPDGAHEVLSTIAGSMITVAGVVFSITIVAIAYAASQYGPRILTNYMTDRGNQVTLGTFIATFVYCLVVLRTIRGGDEGQFVPQLAVMVGLLLALCSIAVLIYFIHHVPNSIHINTVVARIGKQLLHSVGKRFPDHIGDSPENQEAIGGDTPGERALLDGTGTLEIASSDNGYIEAVDDETLMETASRHDLVVRLHHRPGEFLLRGQVLVSAWPGQNVDEDTMRDLRQSYSIGNRRTPAQDMFFLVDELVEIAARALSTGVNDPYTAITCLDWLAAGAAEISRRRIPSRRRADKDGALRVIAQPRSFGAFIERGFGRMRQYVARDMNAATHAFDSLAAVGTQCKSTEARQALEAEAKKLLALAEQELHGPSLEHVRKHYRATAASLA